MCTFLPPGGAGPPGGQKGHPRGAPPQGGPVIAKIGLLAPKGPILGPPAGGRPGAPGGPRGRPRAPGPGPRKFPAPGGTLPGGPRRGSGRGSPRGTPDGGVITVPTGDALRYAMRNASVLPPKHSVTRREGPRSCHAFVWGHCVGGCIPQCPIALRANGLGELAYANCVADPCCRHGNQRQRRKLRILRVSEGLAPAFIAESGYPSTPSPEAPIGEGADRPCRPQTAARADCLIPPLGRSPDAGGLRPPGGPRTSPESGEGSGLDPPHPPGLDVDPRARQTSRNPAPRGRISPVFWPLRCKVEGGWGGSAHYPDPTAQSVI